MSRGLSGISVVILVILSEVGWPIENPAVRSPIVSGTVPSSSVRSGLIQSPNPNDAHTSQAITGSKYFRGLVSYGSATNFQAPLDSFLRSSTNSADFGRYTDAFSPYWPTGPATRRYRPLFSPTGTVISARAGLADTLIPATTRIGGRVGLLRSGPTTDELTVRPVADRQAASGFDASAGQTSFRRPQMQSMAFGEFRPMSRTPQELGKLISGELGTGLPERGVLRHLRGERSPLSRAATQHGFKSAVEQYQDRIGQFRHRLNGLNQIVPDSIRLQAPDLRQSLPAEITESEGESFLRSSTTADKSLRGPRPGPLSMQGQAPLRESKDGMELISVEASVASWLPTRIRSSERAKQFETRLQQQASELAAPSLPQAGMSAPLKERLWLPRSEVGLPPSRDPVSSLQRRQSISSEEVFPSDRVPLEVRTVAERKTTVAPKQVDKQLDAYKRIRRRLDDLIKPDTRYSMHDARSSSRIEDRESRIKDRDKFDWYIKAAQLYLKQGRYYRAADAYALASIYKPDDPLAYAGRGQALFAAGEYISSALFLSRALQMLSEGKFEISNLKFEIPEDKLAKRIADAEERLQITDAAELHFLLGYVYYQMGRLDQAKKVIDTADQQIQISNFEIRDSAAKLRQAIDAVKRAVDEALLRRPTK